jgi:uncharacterized delta-60 repeat protein
MRLARRLVTAATTAALLLAASNVAPALDPGDIDGSYGGDGIGELGGAAFDESAHACAYRNDGGIDVAGESTTGDGDWLAGRLTANGEPKAKFSNGFTTLDDGDIDRARSVMTADGRVYTFGNRYDGSVPSLMVAAFDSSGELDHGFGGDGIVRRGFASKSTYGNEGLVQPDKKILVVGEVYDTGTGQGDFLILRLRPNGTLDDSFSGDGIRTIDFELTAAGDDGGWDLLLQPDGRIVLSGWADDGVSYRTAVVRLLDDGRLDPTFSGDGRATFDLSDEYDAGSGSGLAAGGGLIIGVRVIEGGTDHETVLKLTPRGRIDTSFADDGLFTGTQDLEMNDIAIQPDGKILGALRGPSGSAVVRLKRGGAIDDTFGTGGVAAVDITSIDGIATDDAGQIVVCGIIGGDVGVQRLEA